MAVDTGRVDPDDAESAMDGSGVPMLELFLRKEAPDGELRRKLVAVRASPVEDASTLGQQLAESLQAMEGLDSSKAVLKVISPAFCACSGIRCISRLMHGGSLKQRHPLTDMNHLLIRIQVLAPGVAKPQTRGLDGLRLAPFSTRPWA